MNNPFEQHGIQHLSPSQINVFAEAPALWVIERLFNKRSVPNASMLRGIAVESGIVAGLLDLDKPIEDCIKIAEDEFAASYRKPILVDDIKGDKESSAICDMVRQGIAELRPYGIPTKTQGSVEYRIEGLSVPIIGFYDVLWDQHGVLTDIKTQHALSPSIKRSHAMQVALYKAAISDNYDARVTYITPKKAATYHLENHRDHIASIRGIALTIQRVLERYPDKRDVASLYVPNYDSFYFSNPTARANAFEIYGF
jgi:hypothetical protein